MIEHVNIITQEAITQPLFWPILVVGCIAIAFTIAGLVRAIIGDIIGDIYVYDHCINLFVHAACMIPILFVTMSICSIWFPVETGRYKYEGTLDPNMTIVEFEEFNQQYTNVRFEDGVWKWEDKE